jgi:hypothetical protein
MKKIEFTKTQEKTIVKRYKKHQSARLIAASYFGVSTNVILRVLRRNRVKIRPRGRYKSKSYITKTRK